MTPSFIPDTLQGALILSLIDFFLSFIIISFIGIVLSAFPLLNRLGNGLPPSAGSHAGHPAAPKASSPATARPRAADGAAPAEHVAAISAALAAVLGPKHRIVSIKPAQGRSPWSFAGRIAHHGSHSTRS